MDFMQRPLKRQKQFAEDVDVPSARQESQQRFESRLDDVIAKYGRDYTGIGDEVDMATGQLVVNNGHLSGMQGESDAVGGSHLQPASPQPDDDDAGWVSTSDDDGDNASESSSSSQDTAHARAIQQMGDNIAAEITRIFTDYGVYSSNRPSIVRAPRRRSPSPVRQRRLDPSSASRRPVTPWTVPSAAPRPWGSETTRSLPAKQAVNNTPSVSIWDPRPSPQNLATKRPVHLATQHQGESINQHSEGRTSSGYRSCKRWSDAEISLVHSLHRQRVSYEEMADQLPGRTLSAIRQRIQNVSDLARLVNPAREPASARPPPTNDGWLLRGLREAALDDGADAVNGSPVDERTRGAEEVSAPEADTDTQAVDTAVRTPSILKQAPDTQCAGSKRRRKQNSPPSDKRVAFQADATADATTPSHETSRRRSRRTSVQRSEPVASHDSEPEAVPPRVQPSRRRGRSATETDPPQITAVERTPRSREKPRSKAGPSPHSVVDDGQGSEDELA